MVWMQLLAVVFGAILGWWMGRRLGHWRWWWMLAAACALVLAASFLGHRWIRLSFVPPMSWAADPRANPPIVSLAETLLMSLLIAHLPTRQTRTLTSAMAAAVVLYTCVWPLTSALAVRHSLAMSRTTINDNGVCLQSRTFTCGPASAVTCLRVLGIEADEGTLAIESLCRPRVGIEPQLLAAAITRMHHADGITADYRWVESLDDLPLPAIACMKTAGGHDIAVLQVTPIRVTVGDPARGKYAMTRLNFMRAWTGAAIVVHASGTRVVSASQ